LEKEIKKSVDESWKDSAGDEKERLANLGKEGSGQKKSQTEEVISTIESAQENISEKEHSCGNPDCGHDHSEPQEIEVNFVNYISSLGFQAMIFMGLIPHPVTNETDKNLDQSKFLIDTLAMLKDKTKGNLNKQEEDLLHSTVYELQLKFVEVAKDENKDAK